jgi:hypothetical protein
MENPEIRAKMPALLIPIPGIRHRFNPAETRMESGLKDISGITVNPYIPKSDEHAQTFFASVTARVARIIACNIKCARPDPARSRQSTNFEGVIDASFHQGTDPFRKGES